jgi:hypothetical protein
MNRVGDDLLLQELERTEDYIHTCADAIDVKAGQVIVSAAFLGIQPAVLLIVPNVHPYMFLVQLFSFVLLSVAALLAHWVLRVGDYPSPGFSEEWRDSVIENRRDGVTEEDVRKTMLWGLVNQAKTRVELVAQRTIRK